MGLPSALAEQLWDARTPFLILAYIVIAALVRRSVGVEHYHLKAATTLIAGHLVASLVAAILVTNGYDPTIAEVVSLAFELLAVVTLGMTAAFRIALPRIGFVLPRILIDLLTGVAVIVVFVIVGKRAGFSVAGLITTSAVLTAVIGLALQDTLGNVMGGLSVQMDKSLAVGDWITLGAGQPTGRVIEIRWRYTAIETRAWETVIIPNGTLAKSQVTILGRRLGEPRLLRRSVEFFVDFRTAPTEVIETVRASLADPVPRMSTEPPPHVVFLGIRDSYGVYAVRYWLTDLNFDDGTDSDIRIRVWFALRRAGIPLSIPASSVFLTSDSQERTERKHREELQQRLAALASVDLFRGLSVGMREDLAQQLTYMPFARGEAVTHEGEQDDGLFMLVSGDAIVRIGKGSEAREVARLGAGQFFGEMSLMTGEARTATVLAATDLVTYRINKPAFQTILQETPSIAEQIADVLVARRSELSAAQNERDEVRRNRMETAKQDLVGKIRGFFGLDRSL